MEIEGCRHVDPDSDEKFCPACKEMLRREREVGLQIVPVTPTPEVGRRRVPPPPMPTNIEDIVPGRRPTKPTVH